MILLSGCDFSRQSRAEAAVKELMKTELGESKRYEEVTFGLIQPISYQDYLSDYITQKELEIDTLQTRISGLEKKFNISFDTLDQEGVSMIPGLSEGAKLKKELKEAQEQLQEKKKAMELLERKVTQMSPMDTFYLLYHQYKLFKEEDTIGKIKNKNFVLNNRFKIVDVYDNLMPQPLNNGSSEANFDLD